MDTQSLEFIKQGDYPFEEELLRDSYSLKKWLLYLAHHRCDNREVEATIEELLESSYERNVLFERALALLPGSYKLWKMYLDERVERTRRLLQIYRDNPSDQEGAKLIAQEFIQINDAYERSLCTLYRMPRIWLDYAGFLMRQRRITLGRMVLDRALRSLPFSQHDRIWGLYLKFASALEVVLPIGAAEIWSRYWRVAADRDDPKIAANHLNFLLRCRFFDEAAMLLAELAVNEPPSIIPTGEMMEAEEGEVMPSQYWQKLCQVVIQHGGHIRQTPVEEILRGAIAKAMAKSNLPALQQNQQKQGIVYASGIFWNAIATWHIRNGRLGKAREVYEEAIRNVPTIRDFAIVFDSFSKMEESILEIELERYARRKNKTIEKDAELDEKMRNFERLMDLRPFLVANVRLKQQPNNVEVWMERIGLTKNGNDPDYGAVAEAFEDGLKRIHPRKAKGSPADVWIAYAKHVEETQSVESAEIIFRRAVEYDFVSADELAQLWIAFGEMVLRSKGLEATIDLLAEAFLPAKKKGDASQNSIYKNPRLWSFYLDLEESRGFPDAVRAAYDRVIDLGVGTLQIFVNYAMFLENLHCVEESFRVYERGISAFGYPMAFEIWNIYLPKYVEYWARKNVERVRDLFEQALKGCPAHLVRAIYIEYAMMEEHYGHVRNTLAILNRGVFHVIDEQKPAMYELLLRKTRETLGITAQRSIFENAINALHPSETITFALRYAALETQLGELERSRSIYMHVAPLLDPRSHPAIWSAWQEFESKFGTESTFRDMLRIKRSVNAKFTASSIFVPEQGIDSFYDTLHDSTAQ